MSAMPTWIAAAASRVLLIALVVSSGTAVATVSAANPEAAPSTTSVTLTETKLAGVPAILRKPPSISKPPILLWHGMGPPDSEQALMEALPLDDVPAVKVYLGLPLFGARAPVGGMAEVVRRQSEDVATFVFEPVVLGAALELPKVVAALRELGYLENDANVGVFGFSAGGASTLIALAEAGIPVGAAVTLNASTGLTATVAAYENVTGRRYAWTNDARVLAHRSDAIERADEIASPRSPPALLIIHGADDAMLDPARAVSLYEELLPLYRKVQHADRLHLELVTGMTHTWTDARHLSHVRTAVSDWFMHHLPSTGGGFENER